MGAICSFNRFNRFMKVETVVSLTMFGASIYMFVMAEYCYVRNHSSLSLILLVLGILFLAIAISTGFEVVYLWRSLKKREETTSPVRRVRFSSLINVYEEHDQSFEEEENDNNHLACSGNGRSSRGPNKDVEKNQDVEEAKGSTGGLSPKITALPSYDYWMSLLKEQQKKNANQSNNRSFRERNCTWYENIDNSGEVKEIQALSAKDKELFENDNSEEIII